MDDAIGQILAAVERKGVRDNTLVVFLSDNGAHGPTPNQGGPYPGDYGPLRVGNNNLPLRGFKAGVYEGGIRTPGVVYWPGHVPAAEVHTPMHAVDWLPTLGRLAGVQFPDDLKGDGQDIWPDIIRARAQTLPRTIYSAGVGFRSAALRYGDWKLVVTRTADGKVAREELFNLADDLGEAKDLAATEPEILADLKHRLETIAGNDRDALANE
jgi:arylsulfatase A-like enzyme